MCLRTSRAPRVHAGHVGESRVRNRASPLCALKAVRMGASVDEAVSSTSGARALVGFVAMGGGGGDDALDSHPDIATSTASATTADGCMAAR